MINSEFQQKRRSKTLQSETVMTKFGSDSKHRQVNCELQNTFRDKKCQIEEKQSQCSGECLSNSSNSKKQPKFKFQQMKKMIKGQLQKLPYSEKLLNIESMIISSRQLCLKYGYFYLTCTMIGFNPESKVKLSVWIHPDQRITVPLHPLVKSTQFECQLQFIKGLKKILKMMFPTIDLGTGRTFTNFLFHISDLKKNIALKSKKSFGPFHIQDDRRNSFDKHLCTQKKTLMTSLKTMPIVFPNQNLQTGRDNQQSELEQKQSNFQGNKYQKATTSTLLDSIRSNNSLKERIKTAALKLDEKNNKTNCLMEEDNPLGLKKIQSEKQQSKNEAKIPQIKEQRKKQRQSTSQLIKKSEIRKKMATSGEIESDFNNLFGSEDFMGSAYYGNIGLRPTRNSVLSQVMEEFQDLLM